MVLKRERKYLLFSVVLTTLLGFYIYTYSLIPKEERKLKSKIILYSIRDTVEIAENVVKFFLRKQNASIDDLLKDRSLRNSLKEHLMVLKAGKVEYVFLIYKGQDGKFRYLIDPDSPEDIKGLLFIPLENEKKILEEILQSGKEKFIINSYLKTIGITYYFPLKDQSTTKAILVIDFSFDILSEINSLVRTIKNSIIVLITVTFILTLLSLYAFVRIILIRRRSFEDALTKVYNRKFLSEIENHIDLRDYIVVIVDIDFFKQINDTYGHKTGDEILKSFASLLKSNLRKEDLVIRYGGEEFLILLKKDKNLSKRQVLIIIERLLNLIRSYDFGGIRVTASFGVNLDTEKARNLMDAIKKADTALYKAKREGRDRIEIYTEETKETSLSDLKEMIEKDMITFVYQPVVNMETGEVLYYEALLRFKQGDRLIPPFKYLEMIKGTFLYSKLSKKVIEFNTDVLLKNENLSISVNLSPIDVTNESVFKTLLSVPDKVAKRMKLEIIETEEVKSYEKLKNYTKVLRDYGYEIALDDFGRGYINFFYITEIPVDYIKIDGSIIRNINKDKYFILTKSIVNFAKEANIRIVAEFIEDKETVEKLTKIGITYGQGYFFGKPEPLENIIKEGKDENIN